jgi:glycerophosphoryl diester phosphodiesterase
MTKEQLTKDGHKIIFHNKITDFMTTENNNLVYLWNSDNGIDFKLCIGFPRTK